MHPHSDICTPILTFGQTPQKRPILAPKKGKNGPKKKRHFPNPYWRGLFAKNRTQIAQNLPLWRHLHFTPAYMGSPPCTLSQHPNIKETGYSNVLGCCILYGSMDPKHVVFVGLLQSLPRVAVMRLLWFCGFVMSAASCV